MSEWVLTAIPGTTALGLIVGLGVVRSNRARAVLVLLAGLACAVMSTLHDQNWVRIGYLVLALVSTFGSGWLWSRRPRSESGKA